MSISAFFTPESDAERVNRKDIKELDKVIKTNNKY